MGVSRRRRATFALFLLVLVGLPVLVLGQLVRREGVVQVPLGEQPGGTIRGEVVDGDGEPRAGVRIEGWLVAGDAEPALFLATTSDGSGAFALEAPPHDGQYLVVAGGGDLRRIRRPFSFVNHRGRTVNHPGLHFVIEPAATLALRVEKADGTPVEAGEVHLNGELPSGLPFGLLPTPVHVHKELDAGSCLFDGLPPMDVRVRVLFDDGTSVESELALEVGRRELVLHR